MSAFLSGLLELLFPQGLSCLACGGPLAREQEVLCPACVAEWVSCERLERPGGLDALSWVASALMHEGSGRALVHRLKYEGLRVAAGPLGAAMAQILLGQWDGLVPVPLHSARERERGFNQALLLAQEVARHSGLPVRSPLVRTRATRQQAQLEASKRRQNLQGAFACRAQVRDMHLLLIDDVLTTGATAREAALALHRGGAAQVGILTATRARGTDQDG